MEALAPNASAFGDLHARLTLFKTGPPGFCGVRIAALISGTQASGLFWIVSEVAIQKSKAMKVTKNIGMLLLAVYLIIDGLLGFGINFGPAIFLLYLVALAAGIFILIGK